MKTLTHELYDQGGNPIPGKLSVAYSWDVLMQDGGVYSSTPKTYYAADGVFSVPILAADDPGIEPGYEGFTTRVSWCTISPDCNGRMAEGKITSKTLQVVLADPEPVSVADLDNVTPATMGGVWYGGSPATTEGIQDVVGAMIVAAGGTYDDETGTITLPSGAVVDPEDVEQAVLDYLTANPPTLIGETGPTNTLLGATAGAAITTGTSDTFVGSDAGQQITTGRYNVAVGVNSMSNTTGDIQNNVAVGYQTLMNCETPGDENTAVGAYALWFNTTARENTAVGFNALVWTTEGGSNVAIGHSCMEHNKTASNNVAAGRGALSKIDNGTANVAIGRDALRDAESIIGSTAVGRAAMAAGTASNTTAIGNNALASVTGGDNTAVGEAAGTNGNGSTGNSVTSGARNTFLGRQTGFTSAHQHNDTVAVGRRAVVAASDTVAVGSGSQALHTGSTALGKDQATTDAHQVRIGGKHLELVEISDPAAPAAGAARLYVKDTGTETGLYLRTDSGVVRLGDVLASTLGTASAADVDDFATAAQGALADSALQADTPQTIVDLTGTAETTGATHYGKLLNLTNASPITLTVSPGVAGQRIDCRQGGAGAVSVVGDGVTLRAMPGMTLVSEGQYARFSIDFITSTEADVIGWMAPA